MATWVDQHLTGCLDLNLTLLKSFSHVFCHPGWEVVCSPTFLWEGCYEFNKMFELTSVTPLSFDLELKMCRVKPTATLNQQSLESELVGISCGLFCFVFVFQGSRVTSKYLRKCLSFFFLFLSGLDWKVLFTETVYGKTSVIQTISFSWHLFKLCLAIILHYLNWCIQVMLQIQAKWKDSAAWGMNVITYL